MISLLSSFRNPVAALLLSLAMTSASSAQALLSPAGRPDRVQGVETAPITLVEYSSPTCGHCVSYHNEVAPRIQTEYVETGKVRLIYRPFVRNVIDAAVFILAESRSDDEYHVVLDAFYKRYDDIVDTSNALGVLEEIAGTVGIGADEFRELLSAQVELESIQTLTQQAVNEFGVTGTPTFFVNDKMRVGGQSFEMLSTAIEEELAQQ